jgi:hypothetical protein
MNPDTLLLLREDLLGPKGLDMSSSRPLKKLTEMRGLAAVKGSVKALMELIRTNAELEEQERPLKPVCLNRVFLGNPGTGTDFTQGRDPVAASGRIAFI